MEIIRHGHHAFRGKRKISPEIERVRVSTDDSILEITSIGVDDFTSRSTHNYRFRFSFDELKLILSAISEKALDRPHDFEEFAETLLKESSTLLHVGSGAYRARTGKAEQ